MSKDTPSHKVVSAFFEAMMMPEDHPGWHAQKASMRGYLAKYLEDLESGNQQENSVEMIAQRLGCDASQESILEHFDSHAHEKGYYLKLAPERAMLVARK